jgi:hypothetical protein
MSIQSLGRSSTQARRCSAMAWAWGSRNTGKTPPPSAIHRQASARALGQRSASAISRVNSSSPTDSSWPGSPVSSGT